MHSVKLDISDSAYDKIMFFLSNVPKTDLKIVEEKPESITEKKSSIVEFFQNSPLNETIELKRSQETYSDRVSF